MRMEVSGCDVLLGVVSSLTDAGRLLRAAVRQSYAHEAARVCVRFLVGNASLLPPGRRRFVAPALDESRASGNDLVWLHADDRNCASKTFAWFTFAARHAPASTKWIAKADDDTFVQTDALAADLAALQDDANPPRVMAGHINWASTWAPVSPGSLAGKPCGPVAHFRGLWRPRDGRTLPDCGTSTRSYPFAAGPLYALSTTLVRLVFRESWAVAAMARTQRWVCSGEDAMLGYCVSLAGALANFTVTLAHMTWVRRRRRRRRRRHEPSPRCHARRQRCTTSTRRSSPTTPARQATSRWPYTASSARGHQSLFGRCSRRACADEGAHSRSSATCGRRSTRRRQPRRPPARWKAIALPSMRRGVLRRSDATRRCTTVGHRFDGRRGPPRRARNPGQSTFQAPAYGPVAPPTCRESVRMAA